MQSYTNHSLIHHRVFHLHSYWYTFFLQNILLFPPLKKQQTAPSTCQVMTPVSWVNQASFEPLGLTLAIPKTPSVTEEVVEPEVSIDPELHLEEILKDHPSIRTRSLAFDIFWL